jgi:hypothetical protein
MREFTVLANVQAHPYAYLSGCRLQHAVQCFRLVVSDGKGLLRQLTAEGDRHRVTDPASTLISANRIVAGPMFSGPSCCASLLRCARDGPRGGKNAQPVSSAASKRLKGLTDSLGSRGRLSALGVLPVQHQAGALGSGHEAAFLVENVAFGEADAAGAFHDAAICGEHA